MLNILLSKKFVKEIRNNFNKIYYSGIREVITMVIVINVNSYCMELPFDQVNECKSL